MRRIYAKTTRARRDASIRRWSDRDTPSFLRVWIAPRYGVRDGEPCYRRGINAPTIDGGSWNSTASYANQPPASSAAIIAALTTRLSASGGRHGSVDAIRVEIRSCTS